MLTEYTIDALCTAIYDKPSPWVAEAYSEFDKEPIVFASKSELKNYVKDVLENKREIAFIYIVYPDMKGRAIRKTILLDPDKVAGHSKRYTWEGWGLISVQLTQNTKPGSFTRVASNSQTRAEKWCLTYPEIESPSTWDWKAVARHTRRLERVLKLKIDEQN